MSTAPTLSPAQRVLIETHRQELFRLAKTKQPFFAATSRSGGYERMVHLHPDEVVYQAGQSDRWLDFKVVGAELFVWFVTLEALLQKLTPAPVAVTGKAA